MAFDGSLKFDTSIDGSGFENGISKIGDLAKSGMKVVTGAFAAGCAAAGAAVAGLTKSAVENYAEYEQLVGGVETLFKDSADAVMKYADDAYKTAGLSANAYMDTVTSFSATLLQSLKGDTKKAADQANLAITDMADNANKMGSSMESIQNAYQGFAKQNYTMLDNLKLGYGGTATEMARLVNESGVLGDKLIDLGDTKAIGAELQKVGFSKIVDAIHAVQTEMGITGTTAKEAATTIQGSVASAKSAWTNWVTGLADDTQDFDQLTENLIDSFITAGKNLIPRIGTALPNVVDGIGRLAKAAMDQLPSILLLLAKSGSDAIADLVRGMMANTDEVVDVALQIGNILITSLLSLFPQFVVTGIETIASLIKGIAESLPKLIPAAQEGVKTIVGAIKDNLPDVLKAGLDILMALIDGIVDMIPDLIPVAIDIVLTIVDALLDHLSELITAAIEIILALTFGIIDAIPRLTEEIPKILDAIVRAIIDNLPLLLQACFEIMAALGVGMITNIEQLIKNIPTMIGDIKDAFMETDWSELGMNIIKGIGSGLKNKGKELWEGAKDTVTGLVDKVTGYFGIHSPSTLMRDLIGKNLASGIGVGFKDGMPDVTDDALTALDDLVTSVDQDINTSYRPQFGDTHNTTAYGSARTEVSTQNTYNIYTQAKTQRDAVQISEELARIDAQAAAAKGE